MKQHAPKKLATFCALIGAGLSCMGVGQAENSLTGSNLGPVTDAASSFEPAPLSATWLAVNNNSLDEMRGGFDIGAGLVVSFGIERAVYINGNLTTSVSFNIPDVSKLAADQTRIAENQTMLAAEQARVALAQAKITADQARLSADQAKLTAVQAGVATAAAAVAAPASVAAAPAPVSVAAAPVPVSVAAAPAPVSVAAAPAPVSVAAAPAPTVVAAAAAAALSEPIRIAGEQLKISMEQARLSSEQAKINSEQAKINSEQARLASEQAKIGSVTDAKVSLVQNGPGNTFEPGPLPPTVAATVIQNTLNDQHIQSLTVINTSVNSLNAFKGLNAQAALRDALGNSMGIIR